MTLLPDTINDARFAVDAQDAGFTFDAIIRRKSNEAKFIVGFSGSEAELQALIDVHQPDAPLPAPPPTETEQRLAALEVQNTALQAALSAQKLDTDRTISGLAIRLAQAGLSAN